LSTNIGSGELKFIEAGAEGRNANLIETRFVSEELTDNLAALGRISNTRRQVSLIDGRCGRIDAQLEVEVEFGNKLPARNRQA